MSEIVAEGTAKAARKNVSRNDFVKGWNSSYSAAEAAEKLGMTVSSVLARSSKHRGEGFPLKYMPKGGGAKLNPDTTLQLIAEMTGKTIEEVRAEGAKLKAAAEARKAARAAK